MTRRVQGDLNRSPKLLGLNLPCQYTEQDWFYSDLRLLPVLRVQVAVLARNVVLYWIPVSLQISNVKKQLLWKFIRKQTIFSISTSYSAVAL